MGEEIEVADAVPQVAFKKRSKGKANFRKKPETPPPASDSGSDFESSDDGEGRRIKRRRKNAAVTASSTSTATRNRTEQEPTTAAPAPLTSSNDATKHSDWYDENLTAKNLLGTTRSKPAASTAGPDGNYKGAANYQSFIQKNPDAPSKFGPIKAPTNVRTVTVTDFAPDVCKDWKQTGYCGFGDSCKFLHSREAYKQGWELDRDWEINTKGKQLTGRVVSQRKGAGKTTDEDDEEDEDELLESIPFACLICRKPYREPIITKCGHYFCESCALQRYRKNPSCAACGEGTGGVFNVAKKLNALLNKKRERARKAREEAIANGEEVSEEEEGEGSD
ncbi:Zinc finger RING-type [Penicillium sp. DV-2018c]|nr:Zinc finger RING-type [Penicillium sp. DV-2018c]KAJ5575993.1 Zinc finger RING-type [Penicillium sp. DV-2018c]